LAGLSCSLFAIIHSDTSSMQTDRRSRRASASGGLQAKPVNLSVICKGVWVKMVTADELQQISSIQEE